jgi:uncharacterized protein YecE (DUF72 family)
VAIIIGMAGWSVATRNAESFPAEGTALERYSARFRGVEINSSFHRPHKPETWARWAASVPADFRFSVKMPKTITHERKLAGCEDLVASHLEAVAALGDRLAVHLVQLPPSLGLDAIAAEAFFELLTGASAAAVACEPRHPSWFEPGADALLERWQVGRVAADPARVPAAAVPGGWLGLAYFRLHGSPVIYRSSYDEAQLARYAEMMAEAKAEGRDVWCIFDNTASSAATGNALTLMEKLQSGTIGT